MSNAPAQPGSGGASPNNGRGGHGGGVIRVRADGTVKVDGTISANGNPYNSSASGAGSGGSIYVDCRRFEGAATGVIRADGGDALSGGGGGGGRIAIRRRNHTYAGAAPTANGGTATTGNPGSNGTVVWIDILPAGTLLVVR
jgi:hypothetical protein